MKSIIVGTAGHIDHGKTALVKALTGIDADRLQEEKRRGITIDLGFAHMQLPTPSGETLRLAFVDVPGHERFVRNMLAGVGGIDLVLLVIAADESIKPQTREHFEILQLLGVQRGITVLTKSDTVDPETLDVVRLEVEEFLRGTFLETPRSPVIAVSSLTGAGLPELKQALVAAAEGLQTRDPQGLARLPIDRVFTMKGFGTVVTGTLLAGTIHKEEELEVFPCGAGTPFGRLRAGLARGPYHRVRVRGVQVHGQPAEKAVAGQRTALNLAGASTEDLSRGMTLAPPNTFQSTRRADVLLRLLPSAERRLKDRARVHFHSYTMEAIAEVSLHGKKQLPPGAESFARIKLPHPALLLPGDRFIIRQFSPVITIGGGTILDAAPLPSMRHTAAANLLQASAANDPTAILTARIARRRYQGLALAQAVAETGWRRDVLETHLIQPLKQGQVIRAGDLFLDAAAMKSLSTLLPAAVSDFQKQNPLVPGIGKEVLREKLNLNAEVFTAVLASLSRDQK